MKKLLFGTAGIPISSKGSTTAEGINGVRELDLDAMELEFVRSVNISKEKAPEVRKSAEQNNVILTCHAPYYINLNSLEKAKLKASIYRILSSARIANLCGAWSVTFHAGFYQKSTKEEAFKRIKNSIKEISEKLKEEGNNIWIRPETTGKETQFGNINEILKLSQEFSNVMPCIDFAHLHARSNGKNNSYKEFCSILESIEKKLGKKGLENMHIHLTGIAYGEKGEKHHLNLKESDLKYRELIKALKDFKVKGVVISESPNIEEDALLVQKIYNP
ncbi:MAG: deoxyribonuclease IV [Candidatus Woesearchaeota archaeon]|jgi:deoxyribonuclease-4|nr:deoxyribonuclease IV [Candidatus Woesearchaeota archaeon]MDP7622580.1 deoxyribonuclease IV [Candidatus Woesearchaeota archaeon]HJN57292.1 deoxyribonuclease IV [Candidatus Woesearchaeota archaeon]|tara:strand:+ start:21767 stop:22594 length:828 start_codon:yes stop_codon:yes gene_type:complete